MIVFRVECGKCDEGHGPTISCKKADWMSNKSRPNYGMRLETPQSDWRLKGIKKWEFCGTTRTMFPKWWGYKWGCADRQPDETLPEGWYIVAYSVPEGDVRVGSNQVLFCRENARLVRSWKEVPAFLRDEKVNVWANASVNY